MAGSHDDHKDFVASKGVPDSSEIEVPARRKDRAWNRTGCRVGAKDLAHRADRMLD
jgi:hypothetical protein